jgi:hypothetical protein
LLPTQIVAEEGEMDIVGNAFTVTVEVAVPEQL